MDFGVIILAIIQGIAEFLPISSSAHLILFRDLFGIGASITSEVAMSFDIALHFGTLLAIGVYFFQDFWNMLVKGFTKGVKDKEGKLLWYLIAATIPAGLVGILFEDMIDGMIRSNFYLIALALIGMGVIIYLVDKNRNQEKEIGDMTLKDAILIGCSQVFALIPGFSRSGTTIAMGRGLNLKREDAAKFSFFLSAPVVLGAVLVQLVKQGTTVIVSNLFPFAIGIIVSFLAGLFCIEFLLKYLKKHDFKLFMWYRIILGIIVIITLLFK